MDICLNDVSVDGSDQANAPRTDEELLPLLCDLLVVSSPQLHERLRQDLDKLMIGAVVRKEFSTTIRPSVGFLAM